MIPALKEKLTSLLIDKGLLKKKDLEKALSVQRERGGSLSDILVDSGYISKDDLMIVLSQELGIPPINLFRYKIEPSVLKLIPQKIAKYYKILPLSRMGDTLMIAITDPLNIFITDEIKTLTGFKISPVLTTERDISEALKQYYGESATAAVERIVESMKGHGDIKMVEVSITEGAADSSDLLRMTQEAPIVKITNLLLAEGVSLRASDILIEPLEDEVRVRYRIDGILQESRKAPPKTLHSAIVSRFKVMAGLNIAERRLPQDGRFKVKLQAREVDFRISVLPSSRGEKVALRILDRSQAMLDVDSLGFDSGSLDAIKSAAGRPHGMILICGPTGCGKTTTLYSVLQHINSSEKNIITVEDPVEYAIEGVNQVTSRPDIGLTFANALRSILRQDPNIIMIGEIRDFETVDIAIKAALTGHLVLSTLHTTTATGSVIRLVNMGCEPFLITSSLILVGAQRLVRKICRNCIEPYALSKESAAGLDIGPEGNRIYLGKGCEKCLGTGYRGRVGIIELLTFSPKIKSLILEGAQEYRIRDEARREGMKTLRENGLQLVFDGVTTIDEVLRVTVGEQDIVNI